jgi:GNAT superfamily N-acetyltransferase
MYPGTPVAANESGSPPTFVALVDSTPIRSASLVECDMDTRPNLSPWLAAVYVFPAWRWRGIGRALVTHAVARVQAFGVGPLYLWTDMAAAMSEALGWRAPCEAPYKVLVVLVMVRDLGV